MQLSANFQQRNAKYYSGFSGSAYDKIKMEMEMVKLFIAKTLYHVSGKNASFSEKLISFSSPETNFSE